MAHQRQLIRDAVVARLKADIPSLGDRIYPNRIRPLFQVLLPCILVYTRREPVEISCEAPREYKRNLQVIIEVAAKADDNLDNTLDTLCELIEESIFKEETFDGLCTDTNLVESEVVILSDGEKLMGTIQIELEMPYFQRMPAQPEDELDALERTNTQIDLGSTGVVESEDELELPQE